MKNGSLWLAVEAGVFCLKKMDVLGFCYTIVSDLI